MTKGNFTATLHAKETSLFFFLRFCRTWTKRYLITSQTRVKRVSRIHHRTIHQNLKKKKKRLRVGGPQSPFSISFSFILFFVLLPFFLNTKTERQYYAYSILEDRWSGKYTVVKRLYDGHKHTWRNESSHEKRIRGNFFPPKTYTMPRNTSCLDLDMPVLTCFDEVLSSGSHSLAYSAV